MDSLLHEKRKGLFFIAASVFNCFQAAFDKRRERGIMTSHEAAVYREIQRNTDMAMKAMNTIADKVSDDALSMQISHQSLTYSELHNEASRQLLQARAESYQSNVLSDALLKTGIHYNTMLNTSTGHIAEMMIKNSTNGILAMEKVLKHNGDAGPKPVALAKQLIEFEEKNVERLKQYL